MVTHMRQRHLRQLTALEPEGKPNPSWLEELVCKGPQGEDLPAQARFIVLHDQTHGSLGLSGRFLDALRSGHLEIKVERVFYSPKYGG